MDISLLTLALIRQLLVLWTTWLQERDVMTQLVQQHLSRAQKQMKWQADKSRTERHFQVGDWVYLKLQPYVQSSLAPRANQKLSFKFFGPFQIVSKHGSVAYKLQLPATSHIHPIFHVSQLKQAVPPQQEVASLPAHLEGLQIPEKILQKHIVSNNLSPVTQGLIKWSGLDISLATWEDLEALQQRFPRAPAWGQAGSYQGGNVSTTVTADQDQVTGPRRNCRTSRPNKKFVGDEWA